MKILSVFVKNVRVYDSKKSAAGPQRSVLLNSSAS